MSLTIDQILSVAYPDVLTEMLSGAGFVDPKLRILHESGIIKIESFDSAPEFQGERLKLKGIRTFMEWSSYDDSLPERDKINLVKNRIIEAIRIHDDKLMRYVWKHILVLSQEYKYILGNFTYANGISRRSIFSYFYIIPRKAYYRLVNGVAVSNF